MIEIDTLGRNKNIFNPNKDLMEQGIGVWDLTRSSVSFSFINLKIGAFYTLTEEAQMRPDVVCLQAYGNLTNIGSLMKVNGVSNPFSISTGTVFAIPARERLDAAFDQKRRAIAQSDTTTNPNAMFRKTQEGKAFKVSQSRKKFLEAQNSVKNPVAQALPPNILQGGESQISKTPSFISLGPSVSAGGPNSNGLPV
jgi:hypothetical protein